MYAAAKNAEPAKNLYAHIKLCPSGFPKGGRAVAVIPLYDLTKAVKIEKMQSDLSPTPATNCARLSIGFRLYRNNCRPRPKTMKKPTKNFLKIMSEQAEYFAD